MTLDYAYGSDYRGLLVKELDERALDLVAAYFRALSEPLRLRMLNLLRDRQRNVSELTRLLDSSQANVSKHLALLARMGLVERAPQGTSVYYRIADPRVYQLCDLVCGQIAGHFASQARMLSVGAPTRRSRRQ
jgi:DNA-binding transcriptional ArsR family regulator